MFCINCGKSIEPTAAFCTHCGTHQYAEPALAAPSAPSAPAATVFPAYVSPEAPSPSMTAHAAAAPASGGKAALLAGAVVLGLSTVGGLGYWGWSSNAKMADVEATQKQAIEEVARKAADEEQRRIAAERAVEAAENKAAQAIMDKQIAAEEAQALAQTR